MLPPFLIWKMYYLLAMRTANHGQPMLYYTAEMLAIIRYMPRCCLLSYKSTSHSGTNGLSPSLFSDLVSLIISRKS